MTVQEIMKKLSEPFQESELEFRVGATNPEKTMGLALGYVQARAIQIRLDEVLGIDRWRVEYKEIKGGFICRLGIKIGNEWIEKEDGAGETDFESVKGGISNAFKRVASSGFGIGRYLYAVRSSWFPIKSKGGKGYEFLSTPKLNVKVEEVKEKNSSSPKESKNSVEPQSLDFVLNFGKYQGKTIKDIFQLDRNYFNYLKSNAKDQAVIKACNEIEWLAS